MISAKETKILNDDEVRHLVDQMLAVMPYAVKESLVLNNVDPEDSVRMRSLAATFRKARETANETLKETSGKTGIPQYRIKAIETANLSEIKTGFLRELSSYFGLDNWCLRWAGSNKELASGLGMLTWMKVGSKESGKGGSGAIGLEAGKQLEEFVESLRPQENIRPELDIGYRITGRSFEIFEIRPRWKQADITREIPVAKATYVKSRKIWRLYWMRADLKWHRYDLLADTKSLRDVLNEIGEDPYSCFWG